jgi:RND family efflux transporter MFP subunit
MKKMRKSQNHTKERRFGFVAACLTLLAIPAVADQHGPAAPLTCLLVPARISDVGSDRGGIVVDVPVKRAEYVEAGQLLVQLDDSIANSDLELASITSDSLGERIGRAESLELGNMISGDEMQAMRTDQAIALAQAKRAQVQLDRSRVLAPFAGFITQIDVEKGELISNLPVVRLVDMSTLNAELVFTTESYGALSVGDTVQIAVDLVGETVEAKVTVVDPFLDASSDTFSIIAVIDNADLSLPAGASCRQVP